MAWLLETYKTCNSMVKILKYELYNQLLGDVILLRVALGVRLDTAYFAENWKHCNKIIFKYVNSIMRPIFNEKVVKSEVYGILWTVHEIYLCC